MDIHELDNLYFRYRYGNMVYKAHVIKQVTREVLALRPVVSSDISVTYGNHASYVDANQVITTMEELLSFEDFLPTYLQKGDVIYDYHEKMEVAYLCTEYDEEGMFTIVVGLQKHYVIKPIPMKDVINFNYE
tara:strand:+ start:1168 stop:1563 length:396 start_codon:yes stop_codon:yes gene_type:complete